MEGIIALFIPILALSIPIVAILSRSRQRAAPASVATERQVQRLQERVAHLEESLEQMSNEVRQLEDKQHFLTRLLEERHSG